MPPLTPPYDYHNVVKGARYDIKLRRQKFINWKALYVDPLPRVAGLAPYFQFHNAPLGQNVEFRGFMGRMEHFGRTVFLIFRDAWGKITIGV